MPSTYPPSALSRTVHCKGVILSVQSRQFGADNAAVDRQLAAVPAHELALRQDVVFH
jgi:hypothetical protein